MRRRGLMAVGAAVALAAGLAGAVHAVRVLDARVEARFRGRLFSIPSRVYSAPLVLFPGLDVQRAGLLERLHHLNYHPARGPVPGPGEVVRAEREIRIGLRPFRYPYRLSPGRRVVVELEEGSRVAGLRDGRGRALDTIEIEPERIAELHGPLREDRRLVELGQVPADLVHAVLAIEDRDFYRHAGIRPSRILAAALANLRAGRIVQGGSTLTQQLVKNFYLTPERSLSRKLVEAVMAVLLERHHGKREILQAYLNQVYMGRRGSVSIHGMGEAARTYFARDLADLALPECALLAGMIKGPQLYSPVLHPERARARRDLVLEVMRRDGWISPVEHAAAVAAPLGVRPYPAEERFAPYFVDFLRRDLERVYGEEVLQSEGLAIFTTLDPRAQRIARRVVREQLARLEARFPRLVRPDSPLEAALVAILPATGEVIAMVGGRDYARSQFNRVTQAHRQPGSAFKPIVALAALSRQDGRTPPFTLASILEDRPLRVPMPDGPWTPANYDQEFRGSVTLRQAIEQSLNVPVVRVGLAMGPGRIIRTARRMGIESPLEPLPSLALGSFEVTLLELVRAYAVIAGGGVRPILRGYADVVAAGGKVLEHEPLDFTRVFEPAETYLVTSLLRGVVDRGTGRALRRRGLGGDVAGKTGTTNGFRDAWFVGFTPDLLVGVWVGFDDGAGLGVPGSVAALPLFSELLVQLQGPDGVSSFQPPPGLEQVEIDLATGLRAGPGCPGAPELFLRGTAPAGRCGAQRAGGVRRVLDWLRERL